MIRRRCRKRPLLLLIAVLVIMGPSAARAGDPKAEARKQLRLGKRLFKQKKLDRAIRAYKRAYAKWQHRVIVFNLALAYAAKGDHVNSAIHVRLYLKKAPPRERRLPRVLKQVLKKVSILIIRVSDPNASIYVDSRHVGRGRAVAVVLPGSRIVEIRKGDRVVKRKTVAVTAGKEKTLELETPDRPAVRPRPTRPARPRARRRRRRRKARPARRPAHPRPVVPPVKPPPETEPPSRSKLGRLHFGYFTTALIITAGALSGATGLSVKTRQLHLELKEDPYNQSLADRGKKYQLAANIMWGVTGACAVATALIAVFTRWRSAAAKKEKVSVMPTVGPAGLMVNVPF